MHDVMTVKDLKNILANYDDSAEIELALANAYDFAAATLLVDNNEILNLCEDRLAMAC